MDGFGNRSGVSEVTTVVTNSELTCFRRCQREHYYRYRERVEPLVPAEALVRGKRIHQELADIDSMGHMVAKFEQPGLPSADAMMLLGYQTYWPGWLSPLSVNVPFAVDIGSVVLVGELDAANADRTLIIEHKTTSSSIEPGGQYWREVVRTNPQASAYCLAFPGAKILWDVLRKPTLRQYEANTRRKEPETDEAFEARILADMAERPEFYFARTTVVRMQHELEAYKRDIMEIVFCMGLRSAWYGTDSIEPPRNPDVCWTYGRPCDFFGVCWEGESLDGPNFVRKEKNHTEEIAERAL
jgi:hypothetical protein